MHNLDEFWVEVLDMMGGGGYNDIVVHRYILIKNS